MFPVIVFIIAAALVCYFELKGEGRQPNRPWWF